MFSLLILTLPLGLVAATFSIDENQVIHYTVQDLTTEGFANLSGCEATPHRVITHDRYYLTVYELKCQNITNKPNGKVVLLLHGLVSASDEFVWRGRNRDLAYQLIEEGYEVWLGNSRGNAYSGGQEHSVRDEVYWNFSFHEMGVYDLPASIDYILKKTTKNKLTLIGDTLGTTTGFVLLSAVPEYNDKVGCFICLSPIVFTSNAMPRDAVIYPNPKNLFNPIALELQGIFGFNQRNLSYYQSVIDECGVGSHTENACIAEWLANPFSNPPDKAQFEPRFIVPMKALTSPTSTKTFEHYAQCYFSDLFQQFDYGLVENLQRYNQFVPPEYDLTRVTSEVFLCVGPADRIGNNKDIKRLMSQLPNVDLYTIPYPLWNHGDFVRARDTTTLLNSPVILYMRQNMC